MRFCTLKAGDRVRMTARARRMFPESPAAGEVLGYSRRQPAFVSVRLDGRKRPGLWAPWLWRRASDGRSGRAAH